MSILPLPRSLDPLPDESLRGYLLRLSYRLEIAPSQLAVLTGLLPSVQRRRLPPQLPRQIPVRRLARFNDASALSAFIQSTRLTPQEAENLQLASFNALRPNRQDIDSSHDRRGPGFEIPWVFATASRWCPQCLAGDTSAIQVELGGPWRKQWHLPAVFICPEHMTLLSDRCGVCLRTTAAQTPSCAIGRATDPRLHPLQCRTTIGTTLQKVPGALMPRKHACGARLTDTSAPLLDVLDLRRLLKLQRELLRYIESDGTSTQPRVLGRAVDPLQYFVDTALTAGLVLLSWPATRPLCPSSTLAEAIDAHIEDHLQRQMTMTASFRRGFRSSWTAPPTSSLACAALFCITRKLLGKPSPERARDQFQELVSAAKHDQQTAEAIRTSSRRSPALAHVLSRARHPVNPNPSPPLKPSRPRTTSLTGLELLTDRYASGTAAQAWQKRRELLLVEDALAAARADPSPTADVAIALVKVTTERARRILQELDREEYEALTIARSLPKPVSWAELGEALGVSTQGIHQQYTRLQTFVTRSYRRMA